jgi:hypothetical protein
MKALLSIVVFLSTTAFADAPTPEMKRLMRVVVSNPMISAQLADKNIDSMVGYSITEVDGDRTRYVMTFDRECMCLNAVAQVTVEEDRAGTHADGPVTYETHIDIAQ